MRGQRGDCLSISLVHHIHSPGYVFYLLNLELGLCLAFSPVSL